MELEEAFAQVLREARTASGISQERLAPLSGVDRTYVSLLERQKRQPSLRMLFLLCGPLGIAPEELVAETRKRMASSTLARP